jgi:hypothetical protein
VAAGRALRLSVEIPDPLFLRAKSAAAERGVSPRSLVSEALSDKLSVRGSEGKPWMKGFGQLRDLRREAARINRPIEAEFGQIEPEDRQ